MILYPRRDQVTKYCHARDTAKVADNKHLDADYLSYSYVGKFAVEIIVRLIVKTE